MRQTSLLEFDDVQHVDFTSQQSLPELVQDLRQPHPEHPAGDVGPVTCILAVHARMVLDFWPVRVASDDNGVCRLP